MHEEYCSQWLSANGDGTGDINFNGDYSATETTFSYQPPGDMLVKLTRLIVLIEDTSITAEKYGNITGGLTNGLALTIRRANTLHMDITVGQPIKTNAEWGGRCYDVARKAWGAGNEFLLVRWTFAAAGAPIFLDGSNGDRLAITSKDDLTGLVKHNFNIQGLFSTKRKADPATSYSVTRVGVTEPVIFGA